MHNSNPRPHSPHKVLPVNPLYTLSQQTSIAASLYLSYEGSTLLATSIDTQSLGITTMWRKHLGHINQQRVNHMITHGLAISMTSKTTTSHLCKSCIKGKHAQPAFPKTASIATTTPLQLVHTDLCGPFPILSLTRNRYFITFINDHTRYSWIIYFLSINLKH